jgi:hypothetical protein
MGLDGLAEATAAERRLSADGELSDDDADL